MKKFFIVSLSLFLSAYVYTQQVNRDMVIVEIAVGFWCNYCPGAAMGADDLIKNGHNVAIFQNHRGDSLENVYSEARTNYYEVSAYPTATFDGTLEVVGGNVTQSMYPGYLPNVDQRNAVQSDFTIDLIFTKQGNNYQAMVGVENVSGNTSSDLVLQLGITESKLPITWEGMDHINFVTRRLVPDQNGTQLNFTGGDFQSEVLDFTLEDYWDSEYCELIAFVQNNTTKEILQGTKISLGTPPGLNAGFVADDTEVCTGTEVLFTDLTTGDPVSWNWSFPGGSPSSYNSQNPPTISYSTPGVYNVSLTVSDGSENDTETKTGYITVKIIIADFVGIPTTVVKGNTVTFTDMSECSPTGWSWSFPGGTPSSFNGQTPPPIHYDTEGTYDVSLTVSSGDCNDTKVFPGYIIVVPPGFIMQNGTITTCEGNFYDSGGSSGSYSNSENFVMTFYSSNAGGQIEFNFSQFDVEANSTCAYDYLNIYNGENTSATLIGQYCGTDSPGIVSSSNAAGALTFEWHSDYGLVTTGWTASINCFSITDPPVANFEASTLSPVINTDVSFTDLSSCAPSSWNWVIIPASYSFVNGTDANSQNPEVQFADYLQYSVSLTVTNANGNDTETKADYINVIDCFYCATSYTDQGDDWISNVSFNTINNSSGAEEPDGYADYTSQVAMVDPGSSHTVSVDVVVNGAWVQKTWVWIDWNQNCDFTDQGEAFDLGETPGTAGTHTLSTSIAIPVDAIPGTTRMRVAERYSSDPESCTETSYGEAEDYLVEITGGGDINLALTVFLEGPFDINSMNPDLTSVLPMDQPYDVAPWNYNGTESVAAIDPDCVDWVLVELRDAPSAAQANSGTILAHQSAFVKTEGEVLAVDGSPVLSFTETITNNLFVVVHHRNHLSVMSATPVTEIAGVYTYDFSTNVTQAYLSGEKLMNGKAVMFAADGNSDGMVNSLDETPVWELEAGEEGFLNSDYNLDGQSDNKDKDNFWVPNSGTGTQVPN